MKQQTDNLTNKRQPVWSGVSRFLKLFFKKPKIISLSGELPDKAIFVANHSAMFGPLVYNLHLPAHFAAWGAYPMLGNYKSRFHFLRDVYFMQKRHKSKFVATLLALLEAPFSPFFYKGLRVLASYDDVRFISTIHQSVHVLDNDLGVMIFPENSNDGYHEVLTEFFAGFVELAKYYYKKRGEDVPIYPVYYHAKKKIMVIGEPQYLNDYTQRGLSRQQIADEFCHQVNDLFFKYIQHDQPQNK